MAERWEDHALCRGSKTPDLWFPDGFKSQEDKTRARIAAEVCWVCPVRLPCLGSALRRERGQSAQYRHGVLGGLTPVQREELEAEMDRRAGVAA